MKLFEKFFLSGYYFTIAIRHKKDGNDDSDSVFVADYTMKADLRNWAADPMLIDFEGKTYLFYEVVEGTKGHIAVCEVNADCSTGMPVEILKDDCHYSYPFVFSYKGSWYMIPESSAANEVRLYQAVSFPYQWKKTEVLLTGRYVDTTVFSNDGVLYLLTFKINGATERVKPKAFKWQLENEGSTLAEIPWDSFDDLKVRGAGQIINTQTGFIRPAQMSTEYRYGDAVAFYAVDECDHEYREHLVSTFEPGKIKTSKRYVNGTHTYCASKNFEAIDIRCRDFDARKFLRKIRTYFGRV